MKTGELTASFVLCDFHTHLLPEMDDGSRSCDESREMLRIMREQGVKRVVLTPHYYAWREYPADFIERRTRAVQKLKTVLTPNDPILHIGAEVAYFPGIGNSEEIEKLCIAGTDCLLLEMPFDRWSEEQYEDVEALIRRGLTVVIAHIERYSEGKKRKNRNRLRAMGAYLQCNAGFFLSRATFRQARKWLTRGEVSFIGSDCHRSDTRTPNLGRVRKLSLNPKEYEQATSLFVRTEQLLGKAKSMDDMI
ncbi:MAG: CpsB/CapC family capsule biosynthesis tyrosine phosphatase [Eubacteriales bacterium]